MMNVNAIGQLLRDSKMQGNLQRHPLAAGLGMGGGKGPSSLSIGASDGGFSIPGVGQGNSGTGFQDLVAMAQAQAEMAMTTDSIDPETARSLAQMRAMSMQNEMLSGMVSLDQGGESRAMNLVGQMNLESILSSGSFGNLLGRGGATSGFDTGRTFTPEQMSSLRQKNGALRAKAEGASLDGFSESSGEANLKMPYGLIRPPKRVKVGEAAEALAAQKQGVEEAEANGRLKSESDILAAQKQDASSSEYDDFTRDDLDRLVNKVSLALGMDASLVKAVIKTESNFNHKAVSRVGAKGLMQLMPGTAKELGVDDPFNPVENVWAGARYLKKMLDRHGGNLNNALASYNWGPGNFDRKGKGNMPNETRQYIKIVNKHYASFKKDNSGQA